MAGSSTREISVWLLVVLIVVIATLAVALGIVLLAGGDDVPGSGSAAIATAMVWPSSG
jgi:hypothetical protein